MYKDVQYKSVRGDKVTIQFENGVKQVVIIGTGNNSCLEYACVGKQKGETFEYYGKQISVVEIAPKYQKKQVEQWVPKVVDLFQMPEDKNSIEAEQLKFGYVNDETEIELERLIREEKNESDETTIVLGHNRVRKADRNHKAGRGKDEISSYRVFRKKPYEIRLDYYDEGTGDRKRIYIGLHKVRDNRSGGFHVLKWNDNFLQLKSQDDTTGVMKIVPNNISYDNQYELGTLSNDGRKIQYNGKTYILELRRKYKFDDWSEGVEFDTEYSSLENADITDPFLRRVLAKALEDKRHQSQMTNIVFSIQKEQHQIMYEPFDENLIVQGCAGSGKTMILTHRISILLNRMPNLETENILILTPNELLTNSMELLSSELEIEKVRKVPVDAFYRELIEDYLPDYRVEDSLEDDTYYDEEILRKAYRPETFSELLQQESVCIENRKKEIEEIFLRIAELLKRNKVKRNLSRTDFEGYVNDAQKTLTDIEETTKNIQNEVKETEKAIKNNQHRVLESKGQVQEARNKIVGQMLLTLERINEKKEECLKRNEIIDAEREKLILMLSKNATVRSGKSYINTSGRVDLVGMALSGNPELQELATNYQNVMDEITLLQQKMSSVSADDVDAQFECAMSMMHLQKKRKELYEAIPKADDLMMLSEETANKEKLEEYQKEETQNRSCIKACDLCTQSLHNMESGIWPDLYSLDGHEIISDLTKDYQILRETIRVQTGRAENIEQEIQKSEEQLIELKKRLPSTDEMKAVAEIKNILGTCTALEIIEETLQKAYEQNAMDKNVVCRIQMLFLLQLCYGYFKKSLIHKIKLLCIDEAQDISGIELDLLKKILGKKIRWNLYGDYMQVSTGYKGQPEKEMLWVPVKEKLDATQHEISINYRNAQEIVNCCNDTFNLNVTPMGLHGKITSGDFSECMKSLAQCMSDLKKGDSIAIIVKECRQSFLEMVNDELENLNDGNNMEITFEGVEEGKISYLDVTMAKGMEFRYVLVDPDGMTENEKYIAYTRAMEKLFVLDEP